MNALKAGVHIARDKYDKKESKRSRTVTNKRSQKVKFDQSLEQNDRFDDTLQSYKVEDDTIEKNKPERDRDRRERRRSRKRRRSADAFKDEDSSISPDTRSPNASRHEIKRHRKTEIHSPKSRHKSKRQQSLGPLSPVDDPDNTARSNATNDVMLDESSIEKKKAKPDIEASESKLTHLEEEQVKGMFKYIKLYDFVELQLINMENKTQNKSELIQLVKALVEHVEDADLDRCVAVILDYEKIDLVFEIID